MRGIQLLKAQFFVQRQADLRGGQLNIGQVLFPRYVNQCTESTGCVALISVLGIGQDVEQCPDFAGGKGGVGELSAMDRQATEAI